LEEVIDLEDDPIEDEPVEDAVKNEEEVSNGAETVCSCSPILLTKTVLSLIFVRVLVDIR
jgi:hypothetical protein